MKIGNFQVCFDTKQDQGGQWCKKCFMPSVPTECMPVLANESLLPEEASKLQERLQRQLEEDIARIFDESIYPDLEIVCGKIKIKTHSCILQARTKNFYKKLRTVLNFHIERNIYDEVYSFIRYEDMTHYFTKYLLQPYLIWRSTSTYDAYTECNIKEQEKLIIKYLQNHFHKNLSHNISFLPSISNFAVVGDEKSQKSPPFSSNVPVVFFTKNEALNSVDSDAFKFFFENKHGVPLAVNSRREKKSSQNLCDYKIQQSNGQHCWTYQSDGTSYSQEQVIELRNNRIFDSVISSDSLLTEEQSSLSGNCSGIFTNTLSFYYVSQLNEQYHSAMENNISLSDSGLESNGFLESNISVSSHKDGSLTDTILEGITSCSTVLNEATCSICPSLSEANQHGTADSLPVVHSDTSVEEKGDIVQIPCCNKPKDTLYRSSKEEKQRQNEEIVILESSSLSSETGSWESVFPPKLDQKIEFIEKNNQEESLPIPIEEQQRHEKQKFVHPTTSCFIDAANLVEPEYEIQVSGIMQSETQEQKHEVLKITQPITCSSAIDEVSPSDWSEVNDNDDSLEQGDKNESDNKNISPTIFEMTPISEDIPCDTFENLSNRDNKLNHVKHKPLPNNTKIEVLFSCNTSNNIVQVTDSDYTQQNSFCASEHRNLRVTQRYNESSPIVSGGASVEDHLPQIRSHTESTLARHKMENEPTLCNKRLPEDTGSDKQSSAPVWVVDMSNTDKATSLVNNDEKTDEKNLGKKICGETDTSEKSSHKFFIDLKSIPGSASKKKVTDVESSSERKNIFSMYIGFGNTPPVKEMPARLSNSLSVKKNFNDSKITKAKIKPHQSTDANHQTINENQKMADNSSTFEEYETLCGNPNISISEIIDFASDVSTEFANKENLSVKNKVCNKNNKIVIGRTNDLFVKLSDLDKPISKPTESCEKSQPDVRMTRSIPDNDWEVQVTTEMPRSIEVMSSFHSENALSLNRLFPHLRNELSRSMPGSLTGRAQFPLRVTAASSLDVNEQTHDASELSSMQSSICRSAVDSCSTEESSQMSSLIGNCQSKLGQDLLRMFLEEIAPDVIVEVSGRRIKAHKCILSSRCQYFAGILSGGWVESAGNVIVLPPFSYNVVQFALCHIYSGVSTIPESISIVELATLADMLGLEGLKEAIMLTLKAKYCHFFHKPCSVCIAGVLECFPLSSVYGLDDLYHKCMRWITKYFSKVWPTKAFATLPKELLDKCYQQHVVNLSIENLVDTVYGCGIIVASLQKNRWAEIVARLCRRLVNASAHFAAARLLEVLRALSTLPAEAPPLSKQALDDCIAAAIEWAPPDQLCRSYAFLSGLVKDLRSQNYTKPDLIANGNSNKIPYHSCLMFTHASGWRLQCEGALVRSAPRSVGSHAFKELPPELKKRLRDLGCIMYGTQTSLTIASIQDKKCQNPYRNNNKPIAATSRNIDIKLMQSSFVPYAAKPVKAQMDSAAVLEVNSTNNKRLSVKNPPKIRTTKAQEERARFNLSKNTQSHDRSSNRASWRPVSFTNTKSSGATSKTSENSDKKLSATNKMISKMVSSRESSRNSSPIQINSLRNSRLKSHESGGDRAYTMSQDSLSASRPRTAEPSSDSLNEPRTAVGTDTRYATYTKSKHTPSTNWGSENKLTTKMQQQRQEIENSNRSKTKIPIYLRQNSSKVNNSDKFPKASLKQIQVRLLSGGGSQLTQRVAVTPKTRKTNERRVPGSLMNATKSSSAKSVSHAEGDQCKCKNLTGQKASFNNGKRNENNEPPPLDIAVMERSGTFLKDEPTFGDKITNLDIDK